MIQRQTAASLDPQRHGRREAILTMLRASAVPLSVASLANEIGAHPNTVRFHLDALVDSGRVERLVGDSGGPGRPPLVYRMSRAMDRGGPSNYRLLAAMLTGYLAGNTANPQETATELGRTWGPAVIGEARPRGKSTKTEVLTRTVGVLTDLGFEPDPHRGARTNQIRLRHCPFLDLVDNHPDVICSLHLGLMRGVLAALHGPVTVDTLTPFVEPDLCIAQLMPITASAVGGRDE